MTTLLHSEKFLRRACMSHFVLAYIAGTVDYVYGYTFTLYSVMLGYSDYVKISCRLYVRCLVSRLALRTYL